MDQVLGEFKCDLDGRFSSVRNHETNLGNFISDIMVATINADCAILNGGTMRSDRIHEAGPFTMRDLLTILPIRDTIVVLNVTGKPSCVHQCMGAVVRKLSDILTFIFITRSPTPECLGEWGIRLPGI